MSAWSEMPTVRMAKASTRMRESWLTSRASTEGRDWSEAASAAWRLRGDRRDQATRAVTMMRGHLRKESLRSISKRVKMRGKEVWSRP